MGFSPMCLCHRCQVYAETGQIQNDCVYQHPAFVITLALFVSSWLSFIKLYGDFKPRVIRELSYEGTLLLNFMGVPVTFRG
jgi:hypothetical protein